MEPGFIEINKEHLQKIKELGLTDKEKKILIIKHGKSILKEIKKLSVFIKKNQAFFDKKYDFSLVTDKHPILTLYPRISLYLVTKIEYFTKLLMFKMKKENMINEKIYGKSNKFINFQTNMNDFFYERLKWNLLKKLIHTKRVYYRVLVDVKTFDKSYQTFHYIYKNPITGTVKIIGKGVNLLLTGIWYFIYEILGWKGILILLSLFFGFIYFRFIF